MVVDGHRQDFLRQFLANDVFVQDLADFLRRRQVVLGRLAALSAADSSRMMSLQSSMHSSQMTPTAGNELPHFVLALAAEGAVQELFAADFSVIYPIPEGFTLEFFELGVAMKFSRLQVARDQHLVDQTILHRGFRRQEIVPVRVVATVSTDLPVCLAMIWLSLSRRNRISLA